MPVTYVDGKPTIAYDSVNDKLYTQDADLQTKIDTLNTKIDSLNTKIDNMQDGTSPISTELSGSNVEGTLDSAAPSKANLFGGKYISADPTFHDGDLVPIRTNAKGEPIIQLGGSTILDSAGVPVKKVSKSVITTIANAVSVPAGGNTGNIVIGCDGTESEVWLMVSIDKQPWSLYVMNILGGVLVGGSYPKYNSATTAYATSSLPAMALVLGTLPTSQGLSDPASFEEAKAMMLPISATMTAKVSNSHAIDTATVTIKVLRIWR